MTETQLKDLETLTRTAERRSCVLVVLSEARGYRTKAQFLRGSGASCPDHVAELEAVADAFYALATALEEAGPYNGQG